jgi:hypothetical protein
MQQGLRAAALVTVFLALAAQPVPTHSHPTLVDHPISSSFPAVYLDGTSWALRHSQHGRSAAPPLSATVPGDVLTDLQRAGVIGDPYYNLTWQQPSFVSAWNEGVWTYSTTFSSPVTEEVLLVFDGSESSPAAFPLVFSCCLLIVARWSSRSPHGRPNCSERRGAGECHR